MAIDADAPSGMIREMYSRQFDGDTREVEEEDGAVEESGPTVRANRGARLAIIVGLVVVLALAGLGGWLGYRANQSREAQRQHNLFLQVARQGAINLTTISYSEADVDVQRILDSSTGSFRDDFQARAQPFVAVVKHAQARSAGTVTEAALESEEGDRAQVLVAVSVKTTNAGSPDQQPRLWRMRIAVQKNAAGAKVSNVEFIR
jgi:Mce-associated membrane protein